MASLQARLNTADAHTHNRKRSHEHDWETYQHIRLRSSAAVPVTRVENPVQRAQRRLAATRTLRPGENILNTAATHSANTQHGDHQGRHEHSHGGHQHSGHDHGHAHDHDHGHTHNHDHDHKHVPNNLKALFTVLTFTATIFFAEIIGGYYSGSLALISDAMHMLSDATGLVVAAVAIFFGRKAASRTATYGYKRIEVIAALVNALSVSIVSVWIVFEAVERFSTGQVVNSTTMLVVGVIGFIANLFGAFILHQHSHDNLNMKGAYLHVLVDLFGSVAVIIAAVVMKQFHIMWADTVASLLIAGLILPRSLKLAWESLRVLLEQAPSKANTQEILQALSKLDEVVAVHDLHVWSLDGSELIATCHMVVDMQVPAAGCDVLDRVQKELRRFGIEHSTVQLETPHHHMHETTC